MTTLAEQLSQLPTTRLLFIEPMYGQSAKELPDGDLWSYEAKVDGYDASQINPAMVPHDRTIEQRNGPVVMRKRHCQMQLSHEDSPRDLAK